MIKLTAIVGIIENDKVWMGADTQHTRGDTSLKDRTPKIFQKGPFTVGATGSARGVQLIYYAVDINEMITDGDEKEAVFYLANELQKINKLMNHCKVEDGMEVSGVQLLVGIRSRLFCIEPNYYVHEIPSHIAIGSSLSYSEGVLDYINEYDNDLSPEEKINRCLELTSGFDNGVSGPFSIFLVSKEDE